MKKQGLAAIPLMDGIYMQDTIQSKVAIGFLL